jgi:hypothetical protein
MPQERTNTAKAGNGWVTVELSHSFLSGPESSYDYYVQYIEFSSVGEGEGMFSYW